MRNDPSNCCGFSCLPSLWHMFRSSKSTQDTQVTTFSVVKPTTWMLQRVVDVDGYLASWVALASSVGCRLACLFWIQISCVNVLILVFQDSKLQHKTSESFPTMTSMSCVLCFSFDDFLLARIALMATKIGVKHGPPTSASACQICRMVESSFFVEFFSMVVFLVVSGWGTSIMEILNGLGISHTDSANALHAD